MFPFKHFRAVHGRVLKKHAARLWHSDRIGRSFSKDCEQPLEISEAAIESCTLSNGIKLICEHKKSHTATIGCYFPAGAMYEQFEERGSALFLEHLLFKRTRYRNHSQIQEEVAKIGQVKTCAMRDMFVSYGTIRSCYLDELIGLFADVILNGITCDEDVCSVKYTVLKRIFDLESNYKAMVKDYLINVAYQDTELTKSVFPESSVIKDFSTESLKSFRSRVINPCFMTMISTGDVSLCKLHNAVCKHFVGTEQTYEPFPGVPEATALPNITYYRFSGAELRFRDDDEDRGFVALGVEGPGYDNYRDYCALNVGKTIIGSWDMSYGGANHNAPYIAHLAYNTDLCYAYESFYSTWNYTGIWGCYYIAGRMKLQEMCDLIQHEWLDLCVFSSEKVLERAVNRCVTCELMKSNDSVERFFDIVVSLARCGTYRSLQERIGVYESITTDVLREAADEYIYDQSPAVAAYGRIENLPDYALIRRSMYRISY